MCERLECSFMFVLAVDRTACAFFMSLATSPALATSTVLRPVTVVRPSAWCFTSYLVSAECFCDTSKSLMSSL